MAEVLRCDGISKWFGDTQVLDAVTFSVSEGEIHALVGENGAGKSTLVRIIAGLVAPDAGSLSWKGEQIAFDSVAAAKSRGIALIHQEPRVFPDLTVLENIWVDEPRRRDGRRFRLSKVETATRGYLADLGSTVSIHSRLSGLSVADQQMVDVASALRRPLKVLIVDEPTASLTPREVERLFAVLRRLRDSGAAIIFIGHRLEEILEIADRITVLRDGKVVSDLPTAGADEDRLIRLMVGRNIEPVAPRVAQAKAHTALTVTNLSHPGVFEDVSFEVAGGEILGIGGLVGAGRTEVLEAIFGVRRRSHGSVVAGGRNISTTGQAVRAGVALVPEDRANHGLILQASVKDNVVLANPASTSRFGIRILRAEITLAERMIRSLRIKARSVSALVRNLSGGNQQKVSLAKWLAATPRVLLIDEPTRGVDIGSKSEIHALLRQLADAGLAVVMVSSDMRELLSVPDRILVIREGRVAGALDGDSMVEEEVMRLAAGA
jgi:rhamnose transport system ATP-binding protein